MKYTWLVEKYLEGELSGEALHRFELEILRNPEAARELERVRSLQKFMETQHSIMSSGSGLAEDFEDLENVLPEYEIAQELEELRIKKIGSPTKQLEGFRTTLAEVEAKRTLRNRNSHKVIVRKSLVRLAAAATVLLLITSTLLLITNTGTINYQALYSENFNHGKADISQRSINAAEETPIDAALMLYNEERFAEAILQFNQVPEPYPNPKWHLYKGLTLMELGRHGEAIVQFAHLKTDPVDNHYGMWYTGLCYLALEDIGNARSVLQEIVTQEGHFMKQSKRVLKKI